MKKNGVKMVSYYTKENIDNSVFINPLVDKEMDRILSKHLMQYGQGAHKSLMKAMAEVYTLGIERRIKLEQLKKGENL